MKLYTYLALAILAGCASRHETPPQFAKNAHLVDYETILKTNKIHYKWHQQSDGGEYNTNYQINKYISKVGNRLVKMTNAPGAYYDFSIIKNTLPHAIAFLDGKVSVNMGLLFLIENEAELAAIIAMNIGCSNILNQIIHEDDYSLFWQSEDVLQNYFLNDFKYSPLTKEHELELDRYAFKALERAGYDPAALLMLHQKLAKEKHLYSYHKGLDIHPFSEERIEQIHQLLAEREEQGGYLGEQSYKDAIKPLIEIKQGYMMYDKVLQYIAEKKGFQALELANEILKIEDKEPIFHLAKARAYRLINQVDRALESYNRSLRLDSNYFLTYLERGKLYYQIGEYTKAIADIELSLSLLPTASGYYYLGESYKKIENLEKAHEAFSKIKESNTVYGSKVAKLLQEMT